VRVVRSEQGQKDYRILLGDAEPEQPQIPFRKADMPYWRLQAIAKTLQSAGRAWTSAQAIALAVSENPELYREYRDLLNAEVRNPAQTRA